MNGELKPKSWIVTIVIIISIPFLALIGWLLYQQVLVWTTPPPRWEISDSEQYASRCDLAAQLYFDAVPAGDIQTATVAREQARVLAERVLTKQIGMYNYISSGGPTLVQATFPDNQQRLSWAYVVVLDDGGLTLLGDAAIVYLDALTGEPLALVSGLTVGDPQMVCSFNLVFVPAALLWPVVFLYVCGLAGLLAVVAAVRVLRRRK